jgi:IS30 family transposase
VRPGGNAARQGARNPNARLTLEAVRRLREGHGQGRSISEMARELGVHRSTVSDVVRGRSWREAGGRLSPPEKSP